MKWMQRIIAEGKKVSDFLRPMQIPLHSAYTSFFLVLSLFPGMLLLLGVLRYTPIGVKDLTAFVSDWLPASLMPTVQSLIEASYQHSSGTVVTVSVIGTLVSASRGMYGVRNGLNAIYAPSQPQGYLRRRSISVFYNVSFLLILVLTLLLYLASTALLDYLWMTTDPVIMMLMNVVDLRSLLLLALQSALFTVMYALLPDNRNRLLHSIPGAVVASLGWLIFSYLFSIYVEYFTSYTNIYGSLYALALGMLWLHFCISIFFLGGALNRFLAQCCPTFHKGDDPK